MNEVNAAAQQQNYSQALAEPGDKKITYKVGDEEITLTRNIVRQYLTRGDAVNVTDAEIVQFMFLCKTNGLNPFVADAYLVKYKNSPAQLITSKSAFMKRAETGPNYEGYQAGVVVLRENKIEEVEGSLLLPGDKLIGGWAKVYRGDRKFPSVARVGLSEYSSGQSTWAGKPATMIRKVAIAQAFREAYPMNLSGLYGPEEEAPEDQSQPAAPALPANSVPVSIPAPPEAEAAPSPADETAEPEREPAAIPVPAAEADGDAFDTNLFDPNFKG